MPHDVLRSDPDIVCLTALLSMESNRCQIFVRPSGFLLPDGRQLPSGIGIHRCYGVIDMDFDCVP